MDEIVNFLPRCIHSFNPYVSVYRMFMVINVKSHTNERTNIRMKENCQNTCIVTVKVRQSAAVTIT